MGTGQSIGIFMYKNSTYEKAILSHFWKQLIGSPYSEKFTYYLLR